MGATVVGVIQASHELAASFNEQVAAVVDKRAAIMRELEAQAKLAYAKLSKDYSYEAKDASQEPFLAERQHKPIRLVRKWLNKAAYDKVRQSFGVAYRDEAETTLSVAYYRLNGLLLAAGSGTAMLKANQQCSDTEWSLICSGEIPSKFLP